MVQFYFLSVLLNIFAGLILVYGKNLIVQKQDSFDDEIESDKRISFGGLNFDSPGFRLVVGVLCVFVGVMKILSVFRNDVPVVGDLLPVAAGFFSGASILLEYYIYTSSEIDSVPPAVCKVFIDSRKIIGAGCILIGILHFVFPQAMLL
ncbi:hypothetical protein [Treponema sp.]|uniref:hypothetical protein n=1 Tax=Treponema sp. TaxID=166 RepID=UPI003F08AA1F